MWIAFNVGIKESGCPLYFDWSPVHAICSHLALLNISGVFGADDIIVGRETPISRNVLRARVTRTWSSLLSRSLKFSCSSGQ
jgi:hypothetical protein